MRPAVTLALALAAVAIAAGASSTPALAAAGAPAISAVAAPAPAPAAPPRGIVRTHGIVCKAAGLISGLAGTLCKVASHPKRIIAVGKKLVSGDPGGALKAILGTSSGAGRAVAAAAGLAAVVAWVTGGAHSALHATAKLIDTSSRPNLLGTWFSSAYWRVAAVAALLTLPFLFAAAIQAILRSDMTLLARAAFGYLPLGMLAIGVAAPMTMLLLAASDEMATIVSSASGHADGSFLAHAGVVAGTVGGAALSPFVAFFVALLTVAATLTLWLELLIREAAVYVIVLMLPLFFAALVWPARRIWAVRAVELLVALILSKFAIVAVLALGGAALDHAASFSVTSLLAGLTLVLLAAFSPWALLRLLPLHEIASAAAGGLRAASVDPLLESAARSSQSVPDSSQHDDPLPHWLQQATRNSSRDSSPDATGDPRAQLPPQRNGSRDVPVSEEGIETAAEEAATAVAASGGATISATSGAESSPSPAAATDPPAGGPEGNGGKFLTAPGADTLPERWHRTWEPLQLEPEMDVERPVGEPISEDSKPPDVDPPTLPDVDPPTLPDAGPRPPATDPDENAR
jgi:hypothetical protein